jgi:hypothetical protein
MVYASVIRVDEMATRASFLHPALGLIGLISLLASGPAVAGRTLCCINEQGRNACGDILPRECYGRAYREVSERGVTLRYVAAPLSAEQLAQRAIDPSFFFSSSLTCAGLALPLLAFMTWPTRALKAFSLPARNSSTDFWLAASTSSIIASMAPVSVTCLRPWACR